MADTKDYLTVYKRFFDNFAETVDPYDQLPVRVAGYRLCDNEIVGETVDWTIQYLTQRNCPPSLLAPITRMVIDEIKQACRTQPVACGYRAKENCYLPLKLMQAVTNKVNEVCLRFCDNGRITSLPPPSPGPLISSCAIKNSRRFMEDRHVILEDFHAFFNIKDTSPASYYAVFDGHAGTDAAIYSVSHLHQFLAESSNYPTDPETAIKDAFFRTDNLFIEKSNKENLQSGTTAVCALLRPKDKKLYVAWLGDSQAVLVRNGQTMKLVNPHKPDREDEMTRIQDMGGHVIFWGTWRVNGQLAVSRAIGDLSYKPYVTAEPDVKTIDLHGDEDFLILACDGLWDFVAAEDVVQAVYDQLKVNPGDLEGVSQRLVQLSKHQGSTDNITVIVAFLTEPSQLAARARGESSRPWAPANGPQPSAPAMEAFDMNTNSGAAPVAAPAEPTNPFEADLAAPAVCPQKAAGAGLLLELGSATPAAADFQATLPPFNNGHTNGNLYAFLDRSPNGKVTDEDDEDEDDDSGPENSVGDVDEKRVPKNPFGADMELQKQQLSEFDPVNEPRHDTPTPPADEVPGVIGLVSDNVAESGEESEDEWNFYRVEPSEKQAQPSSEKEQQTKQEVCQEPPQKVEETDDDNMESQLNPNAAEFIPSPTHGMPSMEEFILSQSKDDKSMDDVLVPSSSEFEKEVSSRPSEVDFENSVFNSSVSTVNTSELLEIQSKKLDESQEFSDSEKEAFVNPLTVDSDISVEESFKKEPCVTLDESAQFSTKAEYGDESTTSFMTTGSEFLKDIGTTNIMETSLLEQDFLASEGLPIGNAENDKTESSLLEEHKSSFQQDDIMKDFQNEPVHISFELQKEIAPHMESQPERVKVDSVDHSPTLESEPEAELELNFNLPDNKGFVDNIEVSYKNEELSSHISNSEDHVLVPSNDAAEAGATPEESRAAEIENVANNTITPRIDEMDFLNEDATKQLHDILEFSQTVDKSVVQDKIESRTTTIESNFMEETQSRLLGEDVMHSEYLANEFQENLAVHQENQNILSNEISTPEYEKLEKVVEASEVFKEHFNTLTDNIAVNFSSVCDSNTSSNPTEEALLESAHPDKVALLDDACVESAPLDIALSATAPLADFIAPLDFTSTVPGYLENSEANSSDFVIPETVPSEEAVVEKSPADTDFSSSAPVDSAPTDLLVDNEALGSVLEETIQEPSLFQGVPETIQRSSLFEGVPETIQESSLFKEVPGGHATDERVPLHIPSSIEAEILQNETLEPAQAPPPTPLITQDAGGEPLNFSRGAEDITEVVEKLSATPMSCEIRSIEESKEGTTEVPVEITSAIENISEQTIEDTPVMQIADSEASDLLVGSVETENQLAVSTANDVRVADGSGQSDLAAAAVAATGVAAATAAVATLGDKSSKKEKEVPPKKSAVSVKDKRPSVEKPKLAPRTTVPSRLSATAAKPKSPTSPVKSPIAPKVPLRQTTSTVPTKPLAKTQTTKPSMARPQTGPPSRTTTVTAAKAKPAGSLPSAKPAVPSVGLSRTKPTPPSEKKPLTNGDIKSAPKRPEQLLTKTSTTKLTQRPASAPAARAISKTSSTVSATSRTKSPLNGPSKPKALSSVTQVKTVAKTSNEKEIKETANKQISTRTTTTVRSTVATTASKTTASATRKIESKIVANGKGPALKPSSMVKTTTTSSKIPPKKPATTTRLKATKTGSIVQKTETVQGSNTVVATNEVKSEVLIETTQTAA